MGYGPLNGRNGSARLSWQSTSPRSVRGLVHIERHRDSPRAGTGEEITRQSLRPAASADVGEAKGWRPLRSEDRRPARTGAPASAAPRLR